MKRLTVNLSIALIAFWIGISCEQAFNKYLEATSTLSLNYSPTQPEIIGLATPLPPPGSLARELERIDEKYRTRCQMPTDWNGDWPTIMQLDSFSVCNDEWATARRQAIKEELSKYMVRY